MRATGLTGLCFRSILGGLFVLTSLGVLLGAGRTSPLGGHRSAAIRPLRGHPGAGERCAPHLGAPRLAPHLVCMPRRHPPRRPGPRRSTSTNWSGYAAYNQQNVQDVQGTWTVPTALSSPCSTAGSNTYSSAWCGIDGYSSSSVEQLGTDSDYSAGGGPSYYAWFEMYPHPGYYITFPNDGKVLPGNLIKAEVTYQGGPRFWLQMWNLTQGWYFQTVQNLGSAQRTSAEWIQEAPSSGGVLPLTNFGTISFYGCQATIGGAARPLGSWSPLDPITMVDFTGSVEAQPSTLSGGDSFSVQWISCGPAGGGGGGGGGGGSD